MSNKYLTWAFAVKGVSPSEKLVLIKLADQSNDDGKCWPSQSSIADDCCLSRETVNRALKKLAEAGLVRIVARTKEGVSLPNVYCLPPVEMVRGSRFEGGSDVGSQGVVTQDHRGSDVASHKPSMNPQLEPSYLGAASPTPSSKGGKRRSAESELPDDFPTDEAKKEAVERWLSLGVGLDVELEAANFRDHHKAKGTRFRDWRAAWRMWTRNSAKYAKARAAPARQDRAGLDLSWTRRGAG